MTEWTADEWLRRLLDKLSHRTTFSSGKRPDGYYAAVLGVNRPCEVSGFDTEGEALEGLVDELLRRAVNHPCQRRPKE